MKYAIFLFCSLIIFSCKDNSPQPADLVGNYTVEAKLKEKVIDTEAIKDTIAKAMEEASKEIEKARKELNEDLDLSNIDTTTLEGKMEYIGKSFGAKMGNLGLEMGDLGKDLGGMVGELAGTGLSLSEQLLRNVKLDVELQADGDVKTSSKFINFGLDNAKWRVENDEFIVVKPEDSQPDHFKIIERNDTGFSIEKDKVILHFTKK
ncbi:MAG TPA: hypothetical protein PLZ32_05910 [Saprospiraceae bacterium]|nr:hypothetical protein [Saprospiraceae bacterium]